MKSVKRKTVKRAKRRQRRVTYDAAGFPQYMTAERLAEIGACDAQMSMFLDLFPSGVARVTRHNLRWAARRGLRIMWIVRRLSEIAKPNAKAIGPIVGDVKSDQLVKLATRCDAIKLWFRDAKAKASAKTDPRTRKPVPSYLRKHRRDVARKTRRLREAEALSDFLATVRKSVRDAKRVRQQKRARREAKREMAAVRAVKSYNRGQRLVAAAKRRAGFAPRQRATRLARGPR